MSNPEHLKWYDRPKGRTMKITVQSNSFNDLILDPGGSLTLYAPDTEDEIAYYTYDTLLGFFDGLHPAINAVIVQHPNKGELCIRRKSIAKSDGEKLAKAIGSRSKP